MKVDKWGKMFGFVKFLEVDDVEELEGRLQDVWVGEMRLKVNIARFGRGAIKKAVSDVRRKEGFKEKLVVLGRSFKDVAQVSANQQGGGQMEGPMMEVVLTEGVMEELRRSFVGFLRTPLEAKKVQMMLCREDWKGVKVAPMGDNLVLLT